MALQPWTGALLFAALTLAACGGGEDGRSPEAAGGASAQRANMAGIIAPETDQDTVLLVSADPTDPQGNTLVATDKKTGAPVTFLDGRPLTSLDQLPQALAEHPWTVNRDTATGNLRVQFAPGRYRLKTGWVWPAQASGHDEGRRIILESNGDAVIQGSEVNVAWTHGAWMSEKPGVLQLAGFGLPSEQLWEIRPSSHGHDGHDGYRLVRARTPNVGQFFYVKGPSPGWPASNGTVAERVYRHPDGRIEAHAGAKLASQQSFQADDEDGTFDLLKNLESHAQLVMMYSWEVGRHKVAAVDEPGKRVFITPPGGGMGLGGKRQRFFIENSLSALDATHEWFYQPAASAPARGTLYFKPQGTPSYVGFEVPRVQTLLRMNSPNVQFVQFKLGFAYARSRSIDTYETIQAANNVGAAIEISHAHHIDFVNCRIAHTGGYGLWLNKNARDITVTNSEFYDMGAGGIMIGEDHKNALSTPQGPAESQVFEATGGNVVQGNRIYNIGHVHPGAVAIWIGRSSRNRVVDNLIKDTTYSGISVGWSWDSRYEMARENKIERNFLQDIGQQALSDMGGIYTLGNSPGTEVRGNVIRDVRTYEGYVGGAAGLYADAGSSQIKFVDNIVLGASSQGYMQSRGVLNEVTGNVFAQVPAAIYVVERDFYRDEADVTHYRTEVPLTLTGNLMLPNTLAVVSPTADWRMMNEAKTEWLLPRPVMTENRLFNQFLPSPQAFNAGSIPPLCLGCTVGGGSPVGDGGPLTVPAVSGLELQAGVHLARDWSGAVLSPHPSAAWLWKGLASDIPPAKLDFQASQWPLVAENVNKFKFATYGWTVMPHTPTDSTLEIKSDGTDRFLVIHDKQVAADSWKPATENWINYAEGRRAVAKFQLRLDEEADILHTWRKRGGGGPEGPRVVFKARKLNDQTAVVDITVPGRATPLTTVNVGEWVSVEIESEIGKNRPWKIKINGETRSDWNALAPQSPDWDFLGPVLFVSRSNATSQMHLKSLQVHVVD